MCKDCWENINSFLLWDKLRNIIIENDVTIILEIKIIIIVYLFQKIILVIMKISLIVLIVGGADIFIAIKINHQKIMLGEMDIIPLKFIIFRVWYLKYKSFTNKNKADDTNPWAIIINIPPNNPELFIEKKAINTNPIWLTDEYAINDFKSFCRTQFILVIVAPINLIEIIQ